MLSSTARSSSAPAVRRAYVGPSRRAVHSSTRLLRSSSSSIPLVNHLSRLPHPQQSCTVLVLRSQPFSTTPSPNSTRRSRRVHREALAAANASLTGRIPAFTGSPPAASPAALRLAAKARLERISAVSGNPPEFLEYEPQKNKPSSVFFWSDSANEMDRKLMARGNYPPPLPKFKHDENQQISKCHPSVWLASAHHLQMMHEGYDRLAFMGDAVAGKCISDLLLNEYYCIAGVMGLLKARLVSNAQFAYFSRIYNIPCKNNENAQGDAFEALVGALYLDGKREGADVDRIVYQWLKELVEPWLELYINQLSPTQKERVVSLHRAVPIGIAVATSNSPNSSQVMMAWESNIATQMIERRLKRGSQPEKGLLQAAAAAAALEGPTVDAIGTSSAAPEFTETWEQAEDELAEEEEEPAEEEEMMEEEEEELSEGEEDHVKEEEEVQDIKALQDSAAVSGKAWPTSKSTPKDLTSEKQSAAERAERAEAIRKAEEERIKAETEVLRKANEDRRLRETQRRQEAVIKEALRVAEEKKRLEEEARKKEELRRLEVLRAEERRRLEVLRAEEKLRGELAAARKEAEAAKRKADEEAEIARKKLEQNRPITKAERRAEKKAQKLEAEWAKLEARKKRFEVESAETVAVEKQEAAERERIEKENAEKEKAEKEKAEKEKAEKEKAEKEKAEKEKAEKEKEEKEKALREKAEKKKAEKEKVEKEKEKEKVEKVDKAEDKATYTPPGTKIAPSPVPDQKKIDALIREKEAARAAKIQEEEEQLKFQRLLHDIQEMENLVIKRRDQTFKNSPYMTEDQKKQFAEGWEQYANQQREKMEKEAGVEVGSTLAYKKPEEVVEEKKEESAGLFGKLWGALTGKK